MKSLTIIIPCYNEEESIPQLFEKLLELEAALNKKYVHSFLFVDDGSKDQTYSLLTGQLQKLNQAKIVKHEVNQNLGAALKTGIKNAPASDYVAFLDSDCTYEPKIIIRMLEEMEKGADLVTVSPYHPQGLVEGVPEWRLFLSKGLSILYRLILSTNLFTFTAMVRIIRQEKIRPLLTESNDFSFVAEMLIKAIKLNYKVTEVPTVLRIRQYGVSKMNVIKTIKSHLQILRKLIMGIEL